MDKRIPRLLALALVAAACTSPPVVSSSPLPSLPPLYGPTIVSTTTPEPMSPGSVTLPPPYPNETRPLAGKLIIVTFDPEQAGAAPYLAEIDLATRVLSPLWAPPESGWIGGMALSPDGQRLIIVYAPPADSQYQSGYPGLFALPGSCTTGCGPVVPEPVVPPIPGDSYYAPAWSPDGGWLYFSHVNNSLASNVPEYGVERVPAAGGQPEQVVSLATWPQVSPDGQRLAYVAFDYIQPLNDLFLAAPDGSGATPVMPIGTFWAVDAPVFSPDGQYIYFSATGPGPEMSERPADRDGLTWLERLTGVQIAFANGAPSDWWRVPVSGGEPWRLTDLSAVGLSGTFSPDGQDFAFVSSSGVGVMRPDGTGLVWVFNGTAIGSPLWLP